MQGKPRDKNALIDDIVWLFKVWDDKKSNSKLNFKFQTPEEGKLCKDLISLFKLNNKNNDYSDVTSLKDARYAITSEFLGKKGYPLWTVKYASEAAFASLPVMLNITDEERRLIDNIVTICMERDLRNPALVKDTIDLISELRFEMKNILNVNAKTNGGWHQSNDIVSEPPANNTVQTSYTDPNALEEKREQAKRLIAGIVSLDDAKSLLNRLCDECGEWLLDKIND